MTTRPSFAIADSDFTVDPRPIPSVHGDALTTFEGSGYLMAVTQSGSVDDPEPATLWVADEVEVYDETGPSDETGTRAQWLRPLMNDEGVTRLAGLVPHDDALDVRAWQVRQSWLPMDAPGQLVATPMTTEVPLLAGTTDTSVVVAGLVTDGRTTGDELSIWSVSDFRIPAKGIWKEMKMASSPDSLSDLEDWAWASGWPEPRTESRSCTTSTRAKVPA